MYLEEHEDFLLENRMYDLKHSSQEKLKKIIHPDYIEELSNVLACEYINGNENAEKIARAFFIDYYDMLSILGDKEKFYEEWREESCLNLI